MNTQTQKVQLHNSGLTSNTLKFIVIGAMLIDHIAWAFVPLFTPLGQIMHIIGRTTAPVMCCFIAEGYYHTRNVKRYALRLFVFAIVSYIPFIMFETGGMPNAKNFLTLNVIYTLLLGLLALWAWDKMQNGVLKILTILALCVLAMTGDWSYMAVIWVLIFGIYHGNRRKQIKYFVIFSIIMVAMISLPTVMLNVLMQNPEFAVQFGEQYIPPIYMQFFQFGVLLAAPLLMLYNGERGGGKYSKWFFYIFYPAHLLIIALIKMYLIK